MQYSRLFVPVILAGLVAACSSTPKVDTDHNPAYDFASARKFAIVIPRVVGSTVQVNNDILSNRIVGPIRDALSARGYQVVAPAQADMLVSFFVTTQNKTDIRTYDTGYGYNRCWTIHCHTMVTSVNVDQYKEGTLFIDFIDARTQQLEWRGTISKRLSKKGRSSAERDTLIREVVDAVMAEFPPAGS